MTEPTLLSAAHFHIVISKKWWCVHVPVTFVAADLVTEVRAVVLFVALEAAVDTRAVDTLELVVATSRTNWGKEDKRERKVVIVALNTRKERFLFTPDMHLPNLIVSTAINSSTKKTSHQERLIFSLVISDTIHGSWNY